MSYAPFGDEWHCTQIDDRNGNLINVSHNGQGNITNITDTLGRVINFNYDANANLISTTRTRIHPGSAGGYSTVNTIYDQMGRAVTQSNATEINSWVTVRRWRRWSGLHATEL